MTNSPFDPADPHQMPKVLADLISPGNADQPAGLVAPIPGAGAGTPQAADPDHPGDKTDPADKDAHPEKDEQTPPAGDEKNPDGSPKDPTKQDDSTGQGDNPDAEDQTYTTTEPGFPIGQLIAGLIGAGTAAGTAAASALMSLPTSAMSTIMPLLQSMLATLGNPNARPALPPPPPAKELPPAAPPDDYTGDAADQLRENNEEHKKDEETFTDKDDETDKTVNDSRIINVGASNTVHEAIGRVQAAAAVAPATGEQAFTAAARDAVVAVRDAIAQTTAQQGQLAQRITTI